MNIIFGFARGFESTIFSILVLARAGYTMGVEAVGGLIAGNLVTTVPLGLMIIQGGAAWDNAKKYVEKGNLGGIGTKTHEPPLSATPLATLSKTQRVPHWTS